MQLRLILAFAALAGFNPTVAFAHHALGGRTAATFLEGVISGCAHPVLGPDHLVFLLVTGLFAGTLRLAMAGPALFVAATLAGIAVHLGRVDVPAADAAIAVSVVLLGLAATGLLGARSRLWLALFAAAGLLHGYAYGESIVDAPASALTGYLVGIGVMQAGLIGGAWLAGDRLADRLGAKRLAMPGLGALTAAIGVILLAAALPAPV